MYKTRYANIQDSEQILAMYSNQETYGGIFDTTRDTMHTILKLIENNEITVVESNESVLLGSVQLLTNSHSAWLLRFSIVDNSEAIQALFNFASSELKSLGHKSVIIYSPSDGAFDERYQSLGLNKGNSYSAFSADL